MHSSRFTIAAHVLTALADAGERPLTSALLAGSVNTNAVVIRRTLRLLAQAKLVVSVPGAAGGSRLARPAGAIDLCDVWKAVESTELFASHPRVPDGACVIGALIGHALSPVFDDAGRAVCSALAETTVADLLARVRASAKKCAR